MLICMCAVMNNPELPLDPNLQTSNLLITFLKYASIVMQDTKGKQTHSSVPAPPPQKKICLTPLCETHAGVLSR